MKYVIYDAGGVILSTGSCPDGEMQAQCPEGAFIMAGEADVASDAVDPQTGAVIPGGRVVPPDSPLTYSQARRLAYPRVEEQLDMLWHAMDDDPSARIEPFYSVIKAVKDAHPKDGGTVFDVGGL